MWTDWDNTSFLLGIIYFFYPWEIISRDNLVSGEFPLEVPVGFWQILSKVWGHLFHHNYFFSRERSIEWETEMFNAAYNNSNI